jgi:hypothetical protein
MKRFGMPLPRDLEALTLWTLLTTKFRLGALRGLMVENRKIGMIKIGFK